MVSRSQTSTHATALKPIAFAGLSFVSVLPRPTVGDVRRHGTHRHGKPPGARSEKGILVLDMRGPLLMRHPDPPACPWWGEGRPVRRGSFASTLRGVLRPAEIEGDIFGTGSDFRP